MSTARLNERAEKSATILAERLGTNKAAAINEALVIATQLSELIDSGATIFAIGKDGSEKTRCFFSILESTKAPQSTAGRNSTE